MKLYTADYPQLPREYYAIFWDKNCPMSDKNYTTSTYKLAILHYTGSAWELWLIGRDDGIINQ